MELAGGFWAFKVLASAVELRLFTVLSGEREMATDQLALELGLPERSADILGVACASLGLLEKHHGGYRNSATAEEYLVEGKPYYFGAFVSFCDHREYLACHYLTQALRSSSPVVWDPARQGSPFDNLDPTTTELFWAAMHSVSSSTAAALADVFDFSGRHRLLDVGGGSAAYPVQLCARYPELTATVYDLAPACDIASRNIAEAGLRDVVDVVAGDFLAEEPLPPGHDVILLSMVMHDWGEATDRALLAKCFDALPSGGTVLISELLVNDDRTGPRAAALMSVNMLLETVGGQNYSSAEYVGWLLDCGFTDVRVRPLVDAAGANGVVTGRKP
ncbi:methyltransferase [Streptomyces sp. NPDC127068]|uniref:methyltransferase n=1 Tax=Streptomyces sp. NPDC127068 TaxID=3347127 RepID=UPI003646FBA9